MITYVEYKQLKAKNDKFQKWLKSTGKNSFRVDELPEQIKVCHLTNDQISAIEVYEFVKNPPSSYFLYINANNRTATTWTGEILGQAQFGNEYRSNMGDVRVPVTIKAINGKVYHGTYFKSSGDYARIKVSK